MTSPRLFRRTLGALPPSISERERDEIADTFAVLWRDARSPARRFRVLLTSFGRLPVLIVVEWIDHLSLRRILPRREGDRMQGWGSVARHALRSLARTPSFTWSVVLLLGLGVGAVTTIFSVVDHVVLRPLPYPAADRLVTVGNGAHSGPTFERLSAMGMAESAAAVTTEEVNLTGWEQPVRLREARVTQGFFAMFGARPALGRLLVPADFEFDEAVLVSHAAWRRVFGADSSVLGRTVRIDHRPRVVVGVLDPSFVAPEALEGEADLWRPVNWSEEEFNDENYHIFSLAVRLKEGVSLAQAQSEADAVAAQRAALLPDRFTGPDGAPAALRLVPLQEATAGDARPGLLLMLAAVTVLLLVACVNVALLFVARGIERAREMSVRRALGAGAARIAQQLATESVFVGLAGATLGAALTVVALRAFRALAPGSLPRMESLAVDTRVLAFAVAVGTLTALAFGLLPVLRLTLTTRENPLRMAARGSTSTRRAHSARHVLVVAEIALSLVLAAQAGWLIQGFAELHGVDLGFRTENIWTLPLTTDGIEQPAEFARRAEAIRASLETVPGVRAASFGLTVPLQYTGGNHCCWRTRPDFRGDSEGRTTDMHPVDAGYFELFGLRMLAGRAWTRTEAAAGIEPVILSDHLARSAFGSAQAAIGQVMTAGSGTYTIVGVVADNRHYGPNQEYGFAAYIPMTTLDFAPGNLTMAVRVDREQTGLPLALARAVWRVEPELAVPTVRSMGDWAAGARASERFLSALFSVFGAVALALMAGGLAGTLLYNVRLRNREFAIRVALGETRASIEGSVLRRGFVLALGGIALGGVGAWMAGRAMDSIVAGIEPRGAGVFAVSVAVLMGVALLSSWAPARRAGQANPMATLRTE